MFGVFCWLVMFVWCMWFEGLVEFVCSCFIGDEFDRDYFVKIVIKLFEFDVFVVDLDCWF